MMAQAHIPATLDNIYGWLRYHLFNPLPADHPLIVHVHIPKTGGTSFNDFLSSSFGRRHVSLYRTDPSAVVNPEAMERALRRWRGAMVISSHSFFHFPDRIAGRPAHYITVLRHPLERRLSYWRYARKNYTSLGERHRACLPPDFMNLSAEQWMAFEERLAGMGMTYGQVHQFSPTGDVGEAERVLERFLTVGILEELPKTLEQIRSRLRDLGIDTPDLPTAHLNSTEEATPQMPIPAFLDDEMVLYEWAAQRMRHCQG